MTKRILCIVSCMDAGGAETFLMKIYRQLDRTRYQMDFCVQKKENFYAPEIQRLGGKLHYKTSIPLLSLWQQYQLVKKEKYQYVMCLSEYSSGSLDLLVAKWGGAKQLIMRSTNSYSNSKMRIFVNKLFRGLANSICTVKIAPSAIAAQFTFGDTSNVHLLPNGLNTEQFTFSSQTRTQLRKDLKATDKLVVGHIGRFDPQKNHTFLLKIFAEIKKQHPQAVLWLLGKGKFETAIKKQASQLGILDSILFLGIRSDIPALLSAMDVFIFPSLFEGMPNAVIEAQTTGLPCLISNTITPHVHQTDLVHFMGLDEPAVQWAKKALQLATKQSATARPQAALQMKQAGYDIQDVAQQFLRLVFEGKL